MLDENEERTENAQQETAAEDQQQARTGGEPPASGGDQQSTASPRPRKRRVAGRPTGPPQVQDDGATEGDNQPEANATGDSQDSGPESSAEPSPRKRSSRGGRRSAAVSFAAPAASEPPAASSGTAPPAAAVLSIPLFQPPQITSAPAPAEAVESGGQGDDDGHETGSQGPGPDDVETPSKPAAGKNQKKQSKKKQQQSKSETAKSDTAKQDSSGAADETDDTEGEAESSAGKRRRRRRRRSDDGEGGKGQSNRSSNGDGGRDEVTAVKGSTRMEAKRQRRREGRESGRRRAPIVSEAEFLARRESVRRSMVVRQEGSLTQIVVLEDDVLVEHYVNQATATSLVGNVYLGRVQNVLPSMEAAFVDIGRGRNAVLYAGEVNWDAAGLEGQPKKIEKALSPGDKVLVQVTKDPVGHKGARLTSQVSLPGRFLVFVPDGSMTGISRKLPDKERSRLRGILRDILPEGAGVIVRTASEGASEEDLTRDVEHLTATWDKIQTKAKKAAPASLLHAEPDLALRIVRDIFNADFESLTVSGDKVADQLVAYIEENAPNLAERISRWTESDDVFESKRINEQLAKALDRKVYLPSGGSLVIDRTEAMTVIDVNTGRFTGQGGNLEETVTRNNLEAAEEVVRQIRLRDSGGIIVIDFIDMVLESNRDLVLRRLVECLGRDRTKHQVAEVTSLGLVQMTRKKIGQGLLETFSEDCECCHGRGVKVHLQPVEKPQKERRPRSVRPPGAHDPVEAARSASKTEVDSDGAAAAEVGVESQAGTPGPAENVEDFEAAPESGADGLTNEAVSP